MPSIQSIERAIEQLPAHELAEFRQWFDESVWDANAGKLDALAAEALAEYHNGTAHEL